MIKNCNYIRIKTKKKQQQRPINSHDYYMYK